MDFSVVIPTYNRIKELEECINSISIQTTLPSEIVIIDDGNLSEDFLEPLREKGERKGIYFVYYKKDHTKERRGLSESKNISLNISNNEIIFILDDDLILEPDFFEKMMAVWKEDNDEKLIGVGGFIKNNRKKGKLENFYNKFFGLISKHNWDINDVGFQVWNENISEREKAYYAHGGVCSYKKDLVKELGGFTTFSGGRTALEDVDFCLRAKNEGYYFVIEPKALVFHNHSPSGRENEFLVGFKESYNRRVIFRNNCQKSIKSRFWFFWANTGWILRQFMAGNFRKGLGMIGGFYKK